MASDGTANSLVVYSLPLGFQQIYSEIAVLNAEVDRKEWSWFFAKHALTEAEIYAHPSFEKIRVICGQIDNLYGEWRKSEKLSDDDYRAYNQERIKVETELARLRVKIIERKPTFLEIIIKVFDSIVVFVRKNLPILEAIILERIGYIANQTIGGAQKRIQDRFKDL